MSVTKQQVEMILLVDHYPFDDKDEAENMLIRNHFSAYAEAQVRSILHPRRIFHSSPSPLSLYSCFSQVAANQCSIFYPISLHFSRKNYLVLIHE